MAMDLLVRAQGICVFSAAYQDETLFEAEIQKLHQWVKKPLNMEQATLIACLKNRLCDSTCALNPR